MGFRDKVRKLLSTPLTLRPPSQEQVRDDIYRVLQRLGIPAGIAPLGIGSGMIDILGGPIQWVNIRLEGSSSIYATSVSYYTEYGVPDYRLGSELIRLKIHSVRIKTFPLVGKVIDLQWKGKDYGLGIIGRLNSDNSINSPIMRSRDLTISANSEQRGWVLSTKTRDAPSQELWNCYQVIARHLLAEFLKS